MDKKNEDLQSVRGTTGNRRGGTGYKPAQAVVLGGRGIACNAQSLFGVASRYAERGG
ncbi:MAG: hypothetical protein LBR10_04120 [Prevotellaceae bacterium]|nr:hypothetical protein [Prevotellaceae bacterium]